MVGGGGGGIRNWILVCFHTFYSDKMIILKFVFIVFSKKTTDFWCIFIVYALINGPIQGIVSIIELSFFIVYLGTFS